MYYNAFNEAKDEIKEIIMEALGRLTAAEKIPAEPLPAFQVTVPSDSSHGDFSANTALVSAKALKSNPRALAQMIADEAELSGSSFDKIEVAGPGFLNFFLGAGWFSGVVDNALKLGGDYGKTELGQGKRVLVEFVSANPTGPMHIGNARGGAIGDCLASLLQAAGYRADREFYINDAGNQISKFGKSLSLRYMQICSEEGRKIAEECGDNMEKFTEAVYSDTETFPMPEDVYLGQDIIEHAKNYYDLNGGDVLVKSDEAARQAALVEYALPINEKRLETDLLKYRIKYDNWFKESSLHNSGAVSEVIEHLKAGGHTYEKDGALWLRATDFGGEQDFVLVRSNGFPTYIVPDIAYHYNKLVVRGYDKAINVLGADHHGYVKRMRICLQAMGIDEKRLDVVMCQMVNLVRDGETVKLSKRSGKAITLTTLLDEVPIDNARFFFNLRDTNTHLDFDLDLAVRESKENPVFYVQYAHARLCRLIGKMAEDGAKYDGGKITLLADEALEGSPEDAAKENAARKDAEAALIRKIAELPETINDAAADYSPFKLTKYVYELAQVFHKFYDTCPIKEAEESIKLSRLALCEASRLVIKNVLTLLKIDAPEKM